MWSVGNGGRGGFRAQLRGRGGRPGQVGAQRKARGLQAIQIGVGGREGGKICRLHGLGTFCGQNGGTEKID